MKIIIIGKGARINDLFFSTALTKVKREIRNVKLEPRFP